LSFASAKVAAPEAATTTIALLLVAMLLGAPRPARAQHPESGPGSVTTIDTPKNDVEKKLRDEIGCTCGGCAHEPLSKCICGQADHMRAEVREQVDLGKSHDEIVNYFIANKEQIGGKDVWGDQQFLVTPLDKGFNRVAWLFPYLLGAGGVFGVGFVAMRWSKHPHDSQPSNTTSADAAMNERLDDELRNLD
jgi:cytochrome c-type biogenesis protein CcmH/NrfF